MAKKPFTGDIDKEVFDAIGEGSFEDMLDAASPVSTGDRSTRSGVIAAIHGPNVLVEFGPREQGCCPKAHFEELPLLGDVLEFVIERTDRDGMLVLSRKGAVAQGKN